MAAELGLALTLSEARRNIPGFVGGGDDLVAAMLHELSGSKRPIAEVRQMSKEAYLRRLGKARRTEAWRR